MAALLCTVRDCHLPLLRAERRLICPRTHSYDVARSGYVNLLQPQDRRSSAPGDTPAAVAARRRFLDRGFGLQIAESLSAMLVLEAGAELLDVGCGEGHYTALIRDRAAATAHGVDISVPAIDAAAKRYPGIEWIVANADRFLPWEDGSFDAVTTITARVNPPEFRRVLRENGTLLVALPAPDDLIELRESILGEAVLRDRAERTLSDLGEFFSLDSRERIREVVHLDRSAVEDVMTSSYRGLRNAERARLAAIGDLDVTLSRDVLVLRGK